MKHLKANEVVRIVTMLQEARTFRQVAQAQDLCISNFLVIGSHRETGYYSRRAGQGCRHIKTQQEHRYLALDALRHCGMRSAKRPQEGNRMPLST